jgi:glycosyltransferase involved in cell wall biosynthesis
VAFLLVGDGAERPDLQRRAEARGLDNVIFTGRQPKQDIPAYLSAADACLVHLKRRDVFRSVYPSKIFEAAAMARPILLGVEGSAEALVRRMGAGVCFQPEDPDALVAGLLQLAGDPQMRRRLGHRGRGHVLEHFNHDRLAGRYLEILETQAFAARGRGDRAPAGALPAPAAETADREVRRCA